MLPKLGLKMPFSWQSLEDTGVRGLHEYASNEPLSSADTG